MKRDMELVRSLMLFIENDDSCGDLHSSDITIDGYSTDEVGYHLKIIADAGFIDSIDASTKEDKYPQMFINGLTWLGYDFLDSIRDEGVWEHTKRAIKPLGSVPLEIVKSVATSFISSQLGLR